MAAIVTFQKAVIYIVTAVRPTYLSVSVLLAWNVTWCMFV